MKRFLRMILYVAVIALGGCSDEVEDTVMYFTGDSLIARWDLEMDFPSWVTYNYGKSGASIDYIESQAGRYTGKEVTVEIGTNDRSQLAPGAREQYLKRYVAAITGLGADRIYLFSLLPRDFKSDPSGVNDDIREFNDMVRGAVDLLPEVIYIDVYDDFLKDGGQNISPEYYSDGLHLTPYGYEIMTTALKCAMDN